MAKKDTKSPRWSIKLNEAMTEEQREVRAREIRLVNKNNADYFASLATAIEAGNPLNDLQIKYAVMACREMAKKLHAADPYPPKSRGGKSGEIGVPDEAVMFFAIHVEKSGLSESESIKKLAEQYGVSTQSIKKKLGKVACPDREAKRANTEALRTWIKAASMKSADSD